MSNPHNVTHIKAAEIEEESIVYLTNGDHFTVKGELQKDMGLKIQKWLERTKQT